MWDRIGLPHCAQFVTAGLARFMCVRDLSLRDFECFFFGRGMFSSSPLARRSLLRSLSLLCYPIDAANATNAVTVIIYLNVRISLRLNSAHKEGTNLYNLPHTRALSDMLALSPGAYRRQVLSPLGRSRDRRNPIS